MAPGCACLIPLLKSKWFRVIVGSTSGRGCASGWSMWMWRPVSSISKGFNFSRRWKHGFPPLPLPRLDPEPLVCSSDGLNDFRRDGCKILRCLGQVKPLFQEGVPDHICEFLGGDGTTCGPVATEGILLQEGADAPSGSTGPVPFYAMPRGSQRSPSANKQNFRVVYRLFQRSFAISRASSPASSGALPSCRSSP